jgi:hypothetical protein
MNNQKIPTVAGTIIIIILAITIGVFTYQLGKDNWQALENSPQVQNLIDKKPSNIACTQEMKQCPDGNYVGRTGPNCEFAPCSGKSKSKDMVGDDRDTHGCIGSAGYTWCEEKQRCLREWEESCKATNDQAGEN